MRNLEAEGLIDLKPNGYYKTHDSIRASESFDFFVNLFVTTGMLKK